MPKQVPNSFMEKIIRRHIKIVNINPNLILEVKNIINFFYGKNPFIIGDNAQQDRDVHNLLYKN